MNTEKFHVSMGDAYNFVAWVSKMHPEVFKEWKSIIDIQRSVEDEDEVQYRIIGDSFVPDNGRK